MAPHVLHGFYGRDPDAALAALRYLELPDGPERARAVTNANVPFSARERMPKNGLWSEDYFGPRDARDPDRWAVIELPVPLVHQAVLGLIAAELGVTLDEVRAVARHEGWWDSGAVKFPPGHPGADSDLRVTLDEWPPHPGYMDEETWRAREPVSADDTWDGWLERWRRARGIDPAAIAADDRSWAELPEAALGADALLHALAQRLGEAAARAYLVWRVPVPPVTERPLERRAGGMFGAGASSRALADVVNRASRARRLIELDAPQIIERNETRMLQDAVDLLVEPATAPTEELHEEPIVAAAPPGEPTWPIPEKRSELVTVNGLAFAAPGRALVDFATATFEIDLASGAVLRRFRSAGVALASVIGGLAVFGSSDQWSFAVFDLATATWKTTPLADTLPFAFHEVHEQSFVVDLATRRRHRLHEICDYPARLLVSPCGRYFYATDKEGSGGVFRYDGELQFSIESGIGYDCARVLYPDKGVVVVTDPKLSQLEELWNDASLQAFALHEAADRWRVVRDGGVFDGLDLVFRFPGVIQAASFDAAASELLVVLNDQLWWVVLDPAPVVRGVLDLSGLHPLFLGPNPKRGRLRAAALNAVLFAHGTLADLANVTIDELAVRSTASAFDESAPLGRATARRIRELATEPPAVLPRV